MSDVRPGYHRTDIGVIPADWEVVSVTAAASRSPNAIVGGPFGSDLVSADYEAAGVPVVRGQNMSEKFIGGEFVFVSEVKAKQLEANCAKSGDLIFTQRGTLGQISIVPADKYDRYLVSQSQMKLTVDRVKHDPAYFYYYFSSQAGRRQIADSAIQTGVPHTNLGILRSYLLPVPRKKIEQRAIAEALSDADELISALEVLIVKKRDIKHGAMQELLTGQRRLPGFHGEWKNTRLDEIADIRGGGTPNTSRTEFWDGGIPWCTPTDITALSGGKYLQLTAETISEFGLKNSSAEIIPPNSVVMTSRATIGECAINIAPVATNQGFKNFVPSPKTDTDFLYYMLGTKKAEFVALCGGSTFLEIGKKQLCEFMTLFPPTPDEQCAIAAVLSDMDTELAALEAKLGKARAIKQGMMQVLLTGEVRLI